MTPGLQAQHCPHLCPLSVGAELVLSLFLQPGRPQMPGPSPLIAGPSGQDRGSQRGEPGARTPQHVSEHTTHIHARSHHAHRLHTHSLHSLHTPHSYTHTHLVFAYPGWHHGQKEAVHHGHCVPGPPSLLGAPLPTRHTPVPLAPLHLPSPAPPNPQDTHLRFTPPLPVPQPNIPPSRGQCTHRAPPTPLPRLSSSLILPACGNTACHPTVCLGAPFTPTPTHPSVSLASSTSEIFANHFLPTAYSFFPGLPPPPGPCLFRELPPDQLAGPTRSLH